VTSDHDFFGASVVEAIYCRCTPLLPRRLAYPEHLSEADSATCLYDDFEDLCQILAKKLKSPQQAPESLRQYVSRYDWQKMAPLYDDCFEELVREKIGLATFG
jgi:glycosyltransferase involved in cell wall biosynthesis